MKEAAPPAFHVFGGPQRRPRPYLPPPSSPSMIEAPTPSPSPSPSDSDSESEPLRAPMPAPAHRTTRVLKSALASGRSRDPEKLHRRVRFDLPPSEPDDETDRITRNRRLRNQHCRSSKNGRLIGASWTKRFFNMLWTLLDLYCICWLVTRALVCTFSPLCPTLGLEEDGGLM